MISGILTFVAGIIVCILAIPLAIFIGGAIIFTVLGALFEGGIQSLLDKITDLTIRFG